MSLSGALIRPPICSWAGLNLNQNRNLECVIRMKLFMTLEHFLSRINKTYALPINARPEE